MSNALLRLAQAHGIAPSYLDVWDNEHRVPESTLRAVLAAMGVAAETDSAAERSLAARERQRWRRLLAPVAVLRKEDLGAATIIVAPAMCYAPATLSGGRRVWGAAAQLYTLRSARNWGIGDFSDLALLIGQWSDKGAGVVGVNPLHALFAHNPRRASPYSPSSRLFLNTLYLDVEAIADFAECDDAKAVVGSDAFQRTLRRLRDAELVDYAAVADAKARVLSLLYAHFRRAQLATGGPRAQAFHGFCTEKGESLRRHALFEALQEHFFAQDASIWGAPVWPEAYRDPDAEAVRRFAHEHAERIGYFEYLQWQADAQLAGVARKTAALGLGVGLYVDLAVSIDRAGAEAWSNQDVYAVSASVGAPPDEFNMRGQNWGLPPLVPERLREAAYAPFIATLRANMRHAGALRIDHVLGLNRLFWIPEGADPADGAYVHYPIADLLGILALESQRQRCLVIGEDLGTVPDDLRGALAAAAVLSYRVLLFERDPAGDFKPPAEYPKQAIVTASTHDLPTLAGWWEARDIVLRAELGLFPEEETRAEQSALRAQDRTRLLRALEREGLLPDGVTTDPASAPAMTPPLAHAIQVFLARTPAQILVVQLEDVAGVREQVNMPATVDTHPNWRRKLPLALERLSADTRFTRLAAALVRLRGRGSHSRGA